MATLQRRKVKASQQPPAKKQAKVQKEAPKGSCSIMEVDNAPLSKMRMVDPKVLEFEATKAQEKDTGGMNKYIKYFPFQYKEFDIPVQNCWLAPDHYNSRIMQEKKAPCESVFSKDKIPIRFERELVNRSAGQLDMLSGRISRSSIPGIYDWTCFP